MFQETLVTELGIDATSGLATSIVSSSKKALLPGVIAGVTSVFSTNTVVTGIGRTAAVALQIYGSANIASKQLQGKFALNPFKLSA